MKECGPQQTGEVAPFWVFMGIFTGAPCECNVGRKVHEPMDRPPLYQSLRPPEKIPRGLQRTKRPEFLAPPAFTAILIQNSHLPTSEAWLSVGTVAWV